MIYKFAAADMDGTLLNDKNEITPYTIEIIRQAAAQGLIFSICTGRPIQGVERYQKQLGIQGPVITYNGAMILDSADGRVLYRQELKADDARLILEAGLNYDTTMCIWSDNKLYGNKLNNRIQEYSQATKVTPLLMPSIDELLAQGITKILWYDDVSQIQQIEKELRKTAHFHNVTFCTSKPFYLEFFNSKVSKAAAIDQIAERKNMKETLARLLKMHCKNDCAESLEGQENAEKISEKKSDSADGMSVNNKLNVDFTTKITAKKSAWEHVSLARSKERPTGKDYLPWLFDYFTELHGDRLFGDDPALIGGIAYLAGKPVTVIAQEKGNGTKENIAHNFGMVSPEGYRKSLRLMKQAEKFHRPVICLVDTPGAFCGLEAEERGQGEAIARNLYELSSLKVPVLSIVIGEGGSGGALALAAGDQVWMMENSIYSILSPEGFASILWKDSTRAKEAAEVMKLTAVDLKDLGIIEQVIPENQPLTRENMADTMEELKNRIEEFLETYQLLDPEKLLNKRYKRFRNL